MMDSNQFVAASGPVDARYLAFLETISTLRPSMHRYCARMTGSVMDGEDVVQEALIEAYRKMDQFDDSRPLKPWLFRIAHNRCIDFLRHKGVRDEAEAAAAVPEAVLPAEPAVLGLGTAVERLVISLPPKERACVLLKDVFDYSLEEIADLVDSSVGGVKAALHRGREKLATVPRRTAALRAQNADLTRILQLYVERFNRRDWDGLRELIAADARLRVADRFVGALADSPYFGNYVRLTVPWRLAVGEVDGEAVIILRHKHVDGWEPHSFIRLDVTSNRITCILGFWHTPWVLAAATSVPVSDPC